MSGEDAYRKIFQFIDTVPIQKQPEIREYLYKIAFNLSNSFMYYEIIVLLSKQATDEPPHSLHSLLFVMAANSFSVSLRKTIDKSSKSNLRKLVLAVCNEQSKLKYLNSIDSIYSSYNAFIDKTVVHQDLRLLSEVDGVPDYRQNLADLEALSSIYYSICNEVCHTYARIVKKFPEELMSIKNGLAKI